MMIPIAHIIYIGYGFKQSISINEKKITLMNYSAVDTQLTK